MRKRYISLTLLIAYSALLVNILILKAVSLKIGHVRLDFSGYTTGPANLIPFKTMLPYLLGEKGVIIAIFNIGGNIGLFVPVGFLVSLIYTNMRWKQFLILAIAIPLTIELTQAVFHIGIFDIDDIILNGLGIMVGYWIALLYRHLKEKW